MPGDEELVRTLRKLVVDHAETRWLALRLDYDVKDLRADVKVVRSDVKELCSEVGELREGQDAMRGQMRSLTQMVGEVLTRMPEKPATTDGNP